MFVSFGKILVLDPFEAAANAFPIGFLHRRDLV
jgi:hypothetical protein